MMAGVGRKSPNYSKQTFLNGKLKDVVKNNKTWEQLEKFKNIVG